VPAFIYTSRRCGAIGVLKYGIIAVVWRRSLGRIFHRTACGFGLLQTVRGTISRTCDYTVTPPGKLAPLHLTPTKIIIIVVVVRLFCFFYITIEIVVLEEQAPRRHISVPVVWSILYLFPRNVLDIPRNDITGLPLLPICILAVRTEFTVYGMMP
jgi:hypothetical protein